MFSPFGRGVKLVSTVLDAELELALRWEIIHLFLTQLFLFNIKNELLVKNHIIYIKLNLGVVGYKRRTRTLVYCDVDNRMVNNKGFL